MNLTNLTLGGPQLRTMTKVLIYEFKSPCYGSEFKDNYHKVLDGLLERIDGMLNNEFTFNLQLALRQ